MRSTLRVVMILGVLAWPSFSMAAPFGLSVRDPQAFGDPATDSPLLYRIDMATGLTTLIGSLGLAGGDVEGLATQPGTFRVFGIDDNFNQLVTINPLTGVATVIGTLGVDASDVGLAFSAAGTLFWADSVPGNLYTVNPTTGAATLVGAMGVGIDGLTFIGGTLFGVSSDNDSLYTINTVTGIATLVGALGGIFPSGVEDGAIELFSNGLLYGIRDGATQATGQIFTVNPTTGAATPVALTLTGFEGLVEVPVPEPATLTLLGLGLMGVRWSLRKRA